MEMGILVFQIEIGFGKMVRGWIGVDLVSCYYRLLMKN